jgi:putative redox protein
VSLGRFPGYCHAMVDTTKVRFKLHGEGTGVRQTVTAEGSSHVIEVDAPPLFGGDDAYPTPITYALAALISCSQVTAQQAAAPLGVAIGSVAFDLEADWDVAAMLLGDHEVDANFSAVRIRATIATDASDQQLELLRAETERRCPIYQLFSRSGLKLESQWTRVPLS